MRSTVFAATLWFCTSCVPAGGDDGAGGAGHAGAGGETSCPAGTHGCACAPDGTCDPGQWCRFARCADVGSGGSGGSGGGIAGHGGHGGSGHGGSSGHGGHGGSSPVACLTSHDCPSPQLCTHGTCVPACDSDADCPAGSQCDLLSGECRFHDCTDAQCAQIGPSWFCSTTSHQCFSGCSSTTDCFDGQLCNLLTHQCHDPPGGCAELGCPEGEHCNRMTNSCEAPECCGLSCPAGEGCGPDAGGGCICLPEPCCTTAACGAIGDNCVIDSPGVCHCAPAMCGGPAGDDCDTRCLENFQICDRTTCTCAGAAPGPCGSANCDACCGSVCSAPGVCDDPALNNVCALAAACP